MLSLSSIRIFYGLCNDTISRRMLKLDCRSDIQQAVSLVDRT